MRRLCQWMTLPFTVMMSSIFVWGVGCSSSSKVSEKPTTSKARIPNAVDQAVSDALSDLNLAFNTRNPAQVGFGFSKDLSQSFSKNLRGRFQYLVFPKSSALATDWRPRATKPGEPAPTLAPARTLNEKEQDSEIDISKMLMVDVSVLYNAPCKAVIPDKNGKVTYRDKTLQMDRFFNKINFQDARKVNANDFSCAVLSYKYEDVQKQQRILRQARSNHGTVKEMKVYIDSLYRGHGMVLQTYMNPTKSGEKNVATQGLSFVPTQAISSGLTLMPADIPVVGVLKNFAEGSFVGSVDQNPLIPNEAEFPYVHARMKEFKASTCRSGRIFNYRDFYYQHVRVGWCDGDSLPTVIDNPRFFAVLKGEQ